MKELSTKTAVTVKSVARGTLTIGERGFECHVLSDGRRVLSYDQAAQALGYAEAFTFQRVLSNSPQLKGIFSAKPANGAASMVHTPIQYLNEKHTVARAIDSESFTTICQAFAEMYLTGNFQKSQTVMVEQAAAIVISVAKVGMMALIDEATGYQARRPKGELSEHLRQWIAEQETEWQKRFPDKFYRELGRLIGRDLLGEGCRRPGFVGSITADIVYSRMAPDLVRALKGQVSGSEKLHQHLTEKKGLEALREHLGFLDGVMRLSTDYDDFIVKLDSLRPAHALVSASDED